jgi:hypothetical protein
MWDIGASPCIFFRPIFAPEIKFIAGGIFLKEKSTVISSDKGQGDGRHFKIFLKGIHEASCSDPANPVAIKDL